MSNWNVPSGDNKINIKKVLRKKKLIKIFNICSYVFSGIFIICLIVAMCSSCSKHNDVQPQQNNVVERAPINRVMYDSETSEYALDINDFMNYSILVQLCDEFDGVNQVDFFGDVSLNDNYYTITSCFFVYDDEIGYSCNIEFDSSYILYWSYSGINGVYLYDDYYDITYISNSVISYSGVHVYVNSDSDSFVLSVLSTYIDIQYDEGLFDAVTDTLTNFITTLGSGITAVLGLFWTNSQLTVLGTLTVIVVSVALAYFLFRFVIGLIRLRG